MNRLVVILLVLFSVAASAFLWGLSAFGRRDDMMALAMCCLGALSLRLIGQTAKAGERSER